MAENTTSEATKGKKNNRQLFYIVLIVLLVLINIFLAVNHWYTNQSADRLETERNELDSLYTLVLDDLDMQQKDLYELEGQNEILDSMIAVRSAELEEKKKMIEDLLYKGKLSAQELANAKQLIKNLKSQNEDFMVTIDSLTVITQEQEMIIYKLNEELGDEIVKTEQLTKEKQVLSAKVELASLLPTTAFEVHGIRMKGSGKEVETKNTKKVEKIRFCFSLPENKVAPSGQTQMYIRLVSPEGSTVAIQSSGSGVITLVDNGEEVQYTMPVSFTYANTAKNVCTYWTQNMPYQTGIYKAYLYQDGHQVGESLLELK